MRQTHVWIDERQLTGVRRSPQVGERSYNVLLTVPPSQNSKDLVEGDRSSKCLITRVESGAQLTSFK
jgi:hypothetical protein